MIFVILSDIFVNHNYGSCLCVQSPRPLFVQLPEAPAHASRSVVPIKKTVPVPSVILCDKIEEN